MNRVGVIAFVLTLEFLVGGCGFLSHSVSPSQTIIQSVNGTSQQTAANVDLGTPLDKRGSSLFRVVRGGR